MIELRRKNRIKKILYSPIVLLILAIIFVILVRGTWGVYKKDKISAMNLRQEKNELSKILERQNNLSESLEYLKTEQGVESEIRRKFRVVKEGEKVSVIVEEKNTESLPVSTSTEGVGFWSRIFDWF